MSFDEARQRLEAANEARRISEMKDAELSPELKAYLEAFASASNAVQQDINKFLTILYRDHGYAIQDAHRRKLAERRAQIVRSERKKPITTWDGLREHWQLSPAVNQSTQYTDDGTIIELMRTGAVEGGSAGVLILNFHTQAWQYAVDTTSEGERGMRTDRNIYLASDIAEIPPRDRVLNEFTQYYFENAKEIVPECIVAYLDRFGLHE
jgi:hypothetical protein